MRSVRDCTHAVAHAVVVQGATCMPLHAEALACIACMHVIPLPRAPKPPAKTDVICGFSMHENPLGGTMAELLLPARYGKHEIVGSL